MKEAEAAQFEALISGESAKAKADADAQLNLGIMHAKGRGGLKQSDVEAVKWYQMAAAQDDANGQLNLGIMYEEGGNPVAGTAGGGGGK